MAAQHETRDFDHATHLTSGMDEKPVGLPSSLQKADVEVSVF